MAVLVTGEAEAVTTTGESGDLHLERCSILPKTIHTQIRWTSLGDINR